MSDTEKPVVRRSIEDVQGRLCVDIFERPDGTFGFEEWRRDAEDSGRWQRIGNFSERRFVNADLAHAAAKAAIVWLT